MIERDCTSCLFYSQCTHRMVCDNFAPSGDDAEDEALNAYIEECRINYRKEWRSYVSEDYR